MIFNWILLIFLVISGGIGKAMRDIIRDQFNNSIFSKIKNEQWKNWFQSNWENKPGHLIWFLWDGRHFGDTLSYVSLFLAMLVAGSWNQVMIGALVFGTVFQLCYHWLFQREIRFPLMKD